jgi:hypothetical protein
MNRLQLESKVIYEKYLHKSIIKILQKQKKFYKLNKQKEFQEKLKQISLRSLDDHHHHKKEEKNQEERMKIGKRIPISPGRLNTIRSRSNSSQRLVNSRSDDENDQMIDDNYEEGEESTDFHLQLFHMIHKQQLKQLEEQYSFLIPLHYHSSSRDHHHDDEDKKSKKEGDNEEEIEEGEVEEEEFAFYRKIGAGDDLWMQIQSAVEDHIRDERVFMNLLDEQDEDEEEEDNSGSNQSFGSQHDYQLRNKIRAIGVPTPLLLAPPRKKGTNNNNTSNDPPFPPRPPLVTILGRMDDRDNEVEHLEEYVPPPAFVSPKKFIPSNKKWKELPTPPPLEEFSPPRAPLGWSPRRKASMKKWGEPEPVPAKPPIGIEPDKDVKEEAQGFSLPEEAPEARF